MVSSIQILYVLAVACSALAKNPCGTSEWRYSLHNNKCYKLFPEQVDWTTGEFTCDFYGAHQISIHNAVDNRFVSELAREAGSVWIGAAMFGDSHSYSYGDKSNYDFENWQGGRRPAYHQRNKCIHLDGNTGKWLQKCCTLDPAAFICQKDPIEIPEIIEDLPSFDKAAISKNEIDFRRRAKFVRRRM